MLGFFTSKRPARTAPILRTRLGFETLDERAMPTDIGGGYVPPPPPPPPPGIENPPPVVAAPHIDSFMAAEIAHGWYTISGHVSTPNSAGLIIRFDGVPSLQGKTAVVDANGNFSLTLQVQTNGNDSGTISAQTTQNGVDSNLALSYMSPTP